MMDDVLEIRHGDDDGDDSEGWERFRSDLFVESSMSRAAAAGDPLAQQ
jgi:hypothetical protein